MATQLRTLRAPASRRRKGQRRPSLIFMLGKSPIWPSSYSRRNRIGEQIVESTVYRFLRFRGPETSVVPFFSFARSFAPPHRSPMVIPARRASETHLNSFRFTSSFRFFRQIFTDLGFFARHRPRNERFLFSSDEQLCSSTDFRCTCTRITLRVISEQDRQTCPPCLIVYFSIYIIHSSSSEFFTNKSRKKVSKCKLRILSSSYSNVSFKILRKQPTYEFIQLVG